MSRRLIPVAAAACAAAVLLPSAASATAPRCPTVKPIAVSVKPSAVPGRVTVSWRRPRHRPHKLAWRVLRDGAVVGQTTHTRMSVAVRDGAQATIKVVAYVGGRRTRCSVTVKLSGAGSAPSGVAGAVVGLAARPGTAGHAVLSWDPALAGTRPLHAYRVLRDGKTFRSTRGTSATVPLGARVSRYQVAAVDRTGRRGPLSSVVTVQAGHVPPSAPTGAAVQLGDTATISWGPSRAIGADLAAYRVIRDGRTVKATTATSITMPRPPDGKPQTYQVLAIDSWGWASSASDPLTFVADHRPPGAPGAPSADGVTDTSVTLSWPAASLPAGSRLRGYRLMRDGVVVMQVPSEHATVGNLPSGTAQDWSVAAVDSTGALSGVSPATHVQLAPPAATSGAVQAFLLASTDASFATFRAQYQHVGIVYPTFYECDRQTAAIEGDDNPQIVQYAQARKVKVMPRFDCQSTTIVHKILTDPAMREAWIGGMTSMAVDRGYDGVIVDFEAIAAADRNLLTSFIADLSDRLHAAGKLLSQAVSAKVKDVPNHPRSTAFDYLQLAQYDDWVFVMAWGIHYARSAPGAQDDLSWVRQVDDYVATMPLKQKFVIGTMLYGMDWPNGGGAANPGTGFYYDDVQQTASRYGATPTLDPVADAYHLTYTDASGVPHDVWFPDAGTIGDRIALARDRGLGIGFWRLGQEDVRLWNDPRLPVASVG